MTTPVFTFKDLAVIFVATLGMVLLAFGDLLAVLALFDVEVIDEP